MKANKRLIKSSGLIGAGVSLALYAVFGLMQGMAIGGTAGILLVQQIYGAGALEIIGASLVTRVILAGGMLTGMVVALIMFLVAGSALGYVSGWALGLIIKEEEAGETGRGLTRSGN